MTVIGHRNMNIAYHLTSYPNDFITCPKCLCQFTNQKATEHIATHNSTSKNGTPLDIALKYDHEPTITTLAPLTIITRFNFDNCKSEKMKQFLFNIYDQQINESHTKEVFKKTKRHIRPEPGELLFGISMLPSKRMRK